jgi:DNA-binding FadR family transcriptional regulator
MTNAPKKAFMEIVDMIKDNILNGNYPIGTKLPAERTLAEELHTSRATVREAFRALESIGVIESRVGQGTFVKTSTFSEQDRFPDFSIHSSPAEVFKARFAIEPYLSQLATRNATQEDLLFMEACLQKMEQSFDNIPEFERLNSQFHNRIATAAKNTLLLSFFDIIENIHSEEFWGNLRAHSFRKDVMPVYHQQHLAMYKAIKERDSSKASESTIQHLKTVKAYMLDE